MNKITFLTLFISLILGACGDKRRLEMQTFTTQLLRDNNKTLDIKAYVLKDSIFQEIELKYSLRQGSTRDFVLDFDKKYDSLSNSLSSKWSPPKSEVDWNVYIADWKLQALNVHQYFDLLTKTDTVLGLQKWAAISKQKIDEFPRALAQIERELLANPKSKEYWFRYTESIFNLWRVDLYQQILHDITAPPDENFILVVHPNYFTLPKVGKPHPIVAFVTTGLSMSGTPANFTVNILGKTYQSGADNQVVFKARPPKSGDWYIPMSFRIVNPLTGEYGSFRQDFYPTVHP
jgi:hypothetical protein